MWLLCLLLFHPQESPWSWPMETSAGFAAVFGELQDQQLNTGIAIICAGDTAKAVHGTRTGVVTRVQATPALRTLTIQHDDGYTSVYASLQGYGPLIAEAIVAQGQDPNGAFGELELAVPVTRADVIATSQTRNDGTPVLNFKLRKGETWIDPFTLLPPTTVSAEARLEGLYFEALEADSRVNGSTQRQYCPTGSESIAAKGRIGVSVAAYLDGPEKSRTAVRGIRLSIDGEVIAAWQATRLETRSAQRGGWIYDHALSTSAPKTQVICFDDRAKQRAPITGYRFPQALVISKRCTLTVALCDLLGQWHETQRVLDPDGPIQPQTWATQEPVLPSNLALAMFRDGFVISADAAGTLQLPNKILGLGAGSAQHFNPDQTSLPTEIRWRSRRSTLSYELGVLPRAEIFTIDIGPWRLRSSGLAKPEIAVVLKQPDPKIADEALDYQSSVLCFGRYGLATPGMTLEYLSEIEAPEHACIYRWSFPQQAWVFQGRLDRQVELEYLAPLVVAVDLQPPNLLMPSLHTYPFGERVVIPVHDRESGIAVESIRVYEGEGLLDCHYDPAFSWVVLPANAKGPWSLVLEDRSGRRAVSSQLSLYR